MSHAIDNLVDGTTGFRMSRQNALELEQLVSKLNVGTTKPCQHFHERAIYLFNFVPKKRYLHHLAYLGRHMSPKLAWCYKGEDLMQKVKILAQGSFRSTPAKILGNKVLAKYLVGFSHALSDID